MTECLASSDGCFGTPLASGPEGEAEVLEGGMTHGVLCMDSFVFGRRAHA